MEAIEKIDKEISKKLVLSKLAFLHLDYDQEYNLGLFYKEDSKKIQIITYDFGYDYRKYNPITLCKESFRARIYFKEVENILNKALDNKIISTNTHAHVSTSGFYLNNQYTISDTSAPEITTDTQHIVVFENGEVNQMQLEKVIVETDEFIDQYLNVFFSEIETVGDLNTMILDKDDFSNYYKYISGETGAKVLIIMKLCNGHKYQEYKDWSDYIIAKQLQDPLYVDYIDVLNSQQKIMDKVYKYLETGAYKDL
jgi:hypothetical protein